MQQPHTAMPDVASSGSVMSEAGGGTVVALLKREAPKLNWWMFDHYKSSKKNSELRVAQHDALETGR